MTDDYNGDTIYVIIFLIILFFMLVVGLLLIYAWKKVDLDASRHATSTATPIDIESIYTIDASNITLHLNANVDE